MDRVMISDINRKCSTSDTGMYGNFGDTCPLISGSYKKIDFVCNLHHILDSYLDSNLNSIVELFFIQCSKFEKYWVYLLTKMKTFFSHFRISRSREFLFLKWFSNESFMSDDYPNFKNDSSVFLFHENDKLYRNSKSLFYEKIVFVRVKKTLARYLPAIILQEEQNIMIAVGFIVGISVGFLEIST